MLDGAGHVNRLALRSHRAPTIVGAVVLSAHTSRAWRVRITLLEGEY
jgi:hypothetical protein